MKIAYLLLFFLFAQTPISATSMNIEVKTTANVVLGVEHPKKEKGPRAKKTRKKKAQKERVQQDKSKIPWTIWFLILILLMLIVASLSWFLFLSGGLSWGFIQLAFGLMIGLLFLLALFPKKIVNKANSNKKNKFWSLFLLIIIGLIAIVSLILGIHFFISSPLFGWAALFPSVDLSDFFGIGFMAFLTIISSILIGFVSRKSKPEKIKKRGILIEILGYNFHAISLLFLLPISFGFFLFFPMSGMAFLIGMAALVLLFGLLFGLSIWLKTTFQKAQHADEKSTKVQRVGSILLLISIPLFAFAIISTYGLVLFFFWLYIPIILSFFVILNMGLWLLLKK
jgi:hypothetical protein